MKQKTKRLLLAGLGILLLLCVGLFTTFILELRFGEWLWVQKPPVPKGASSIKTLYPSTDIERIIEFETDQSVEALSKYYEGKLTERGWRYVCSAAEEAEPNCPFALSYDAVRSDGYVKDDPKKEHSLQVTIYLAGTLQRSKEYQTVELSEQYFNRTSSNP